MSEDRPADTNTFQTHLRIGIYWDRHLSGSHHTHTPSGLFDTQTNREQDRGLPSGVSTIAQASSSDFSVYAAVLQSSQRGAVLEPSAQEIVVQERFSSRIRGINPTVVSESPNLDHGLAKLVRAGALAVQICSSGPMRQRDFSNPQCCDTETAIQAKRNNSREISFVKSDANELNKKLKELDISNENNKKNLVRLAKKYKKYNEFIKNNRSKKLIATKNIKNIIARLKKEDRVVKKSITKLDKKYKKTKSLLNKTSLGDRHKERIKGFLKIIRHAKKTNKKNYIKLKNYKLIKTISRKLNKYQASAKKNRIK